MLALKPYWGKPTVRDFRGGNGDVGIIRSPVRAIALLDHLVIIDDYCATGTRAIAAQLLAAAEIHSIVTVRESALEVRLERDSTRPDVPGPVFELRVQ